MGSMTDERRKEMEEEMMRFEQEILGPGRDDEDRPLKSQKPNNGESQKKPLPPPPHLAAMLPEVLKPPPPPPVSQNVAREPLRPPPIPHLQPQFIPHQIQRPPSRPAPMPMQGPHGFHGPNTMRFGPHMPHPPMPMQMPPMGMPMHPGFCPPPPPGMPMGPMPPHPPPQQFIPPMQMQFNEPVSGSAEQEPEPEKSRSEATTVAAPAVYAAPPMKSEKRANSPVTNGSSSVTTVASPSLQQLIMESKSVKGTEESPSSTDATSNKKEKKKKKIVRMAGGQAWEDNSLMDWESDDFRIFCGDLGNDVTDEVLVRAFSKYPSFTKAKVIRDKRTNKTKGYGFVSFKDPQDFIKAMREMNGRYVGSRPIKLRKSTWKDRNIDLVRKKQKEKEKLGLL